MMDIQAIQEQIDAIPADVAALDKIGIMLPIVRLILRVRDDRTRDRLVEQLAAALSLDPRVVRYEMAYAVQNGALH